MLYPALRPGARPLKGPLAAPCCPATHTCGTTAGACGCCTRGRWALFCALLALILATVALMLTAGAAAPIDWGVAYRGAYTSDSAVPYATFTETVQAAAGGARASLCVNATPAPGSLGELQCSDCAGGRDGEPWVCSAAAGGSGGALALSYPALDVLNPSLRNSARGAARAAAFFTALLVAALAALAALLGDASRMARGRGAAGASPACPGLYALRPWATLALAGAHACAVLALGLAIGAMANFSDGFVAAARAALRASGQCAALGEQGSGSAPPAGFEGVLCWSDGTTGYPLVIIGWVLVLAALLPCLAVAACCASGWMFCRHSGAEVQVEAAWGMGAAQAAGGLLVPPAALLQEAPYWQQQQAVVEQPWPPQAVLQHPLSQQQALKPQHPLYSQQLQLVQQQLAQQQLEALELQRRGQQGGAAGGGEGAGEGAGAAPVLDARQAAQQALAVAQMAALEQQRRLQHVQQGPWGPAAAPAAGAGGAGVAWMAPPGMQQPAGAGVPGGWGASAPEQAPQAAPAVATRGSEAALLQGGQQPTPPPLASGGGSAP